MSLLISDVFSEIQMKQKAIAQSAVAAAAASEDEKASAQSQCIMELKDGLVFISYVFSYEPIDI